MPDLLDELKALAEQWRTLSDAWVAENPENELMPWMRRAALGCATELTTLIARHESRLRNIPGQAGHRIAVSPQAVRIFLYDEWVTSVPTQIMVEELEKSGVIRHESRRPAASLGPYIYDGTWRHLDGDALGLENAIDDALEGKTGRYCVTVEDAERVEPRGKVVAELGPYELNGKCQVCLSDEEGEVQKINLEPRVSGHKYRTLIIELPEGSDG